MSTDRYSTKPIFSMVLIFSSGKQRWSLIFKRESILQPYKLLYSGCNLLFIICPFRLSMNHKQLTKHNLILAFQGWFMVPDSTKWQKQYIAPCPELNNWIHKHEALGVPLNLTVTRRHRQFKIHYKRTKDLKFLTVTRDTASYKDCLLESLLTCSSHNYWVRFVQSYHLTWSQSFHARWDWHRSLDHLHLWRHEYPTNWAVYNGTSAAASSECPFNEITGAE